MVALGKLSHGEWNGVVFTNDLTVNYFNHLDKSWPKIDYTRDVVRANNPVFFFQKHSILTEMFDRKIELCQESGLVFHWVAQFKHNWKKHKQKQPKKLGISGIMAMLEISAVLYLIAFLVFILEILSQKHQRIRRLLDFLTHWVWLLDFF